MQKISFGGKEYVRATEIAKKFRYTADYVGQLCRSKKVDARLVGRNWYVVPESVSSYQKTKHSTQKTVAKKVSAAKSGVQTRKRRVVRKVEAVDRTKTIRLAAPPRKISGTRVSVAYDADDAVLVPILATKNDPNKEPRKKAIIVDSRPAVAIAVKSDKRSDTKFISEKLPEISLSGKLSVSDHLETPVAIVEDKSNSVIDPKSFAASFEEKLNKKNGIEHGLEADQSKKDVSIKKSSLVNTKNQQNKVDFVPTSIVETDQPSSTPLPLLISVTMALLASILIITLRSELLVSNEEYKAGYKIDVSSLSEILNIF